MNYELLIAPLQFTHAKLSHHSICACNSKIAKISQARLFLRGTVSVILSEPPCKDDNARFTVVPLIAFFQFMNYIDVNVFNPLKTDLIVNCELIIKLTCAFLLQENMIGSFSGLSTFKSKKYN